MTATFASEKSKGKPVPERSTCKTRDPWYNLTGLVKPGFAFWPKAQQYRHIIPKNPERVIGNCNLYDVASDELILPEQESLVAILNSTYFGKTRKIFKDYSSREQAELVVSLANLGVTGEVTLPAKAGPCRKLLERLEGRIQTATARFQELAASRTSDEKMRANLVDLLRRWFLLGREAPVKAEPEARERRAEVLPFPLVQPRPEDR
jgi:hypothetical protein